MGVRGVPLWRKTSKVAVLEQSPAFRGLSRRELARVAGLADEVEVPAGKQLTAMGETGREFFVIVAGQADVRTARGRRIRLGPGSSSGR